MEALAVVLVLVHYLSHDPRRVWVFQRRIKQSVKLLEQREEHDQRADSDNPEATAKRLHEAIVGHRFQPHRAKKPPVSKAAAVGDTKTYCRGLACAGQSFAPRSWLRQSAKVSKMVISN